MAYIKAYVRVSDVSEMLTDDAEKLGLLLNDLGWNYNGEIGHDKYKILRRMGNNGRDFVKLLVAAIEEEEKSC